MAASFRRPMNSSHRAGSPHAKEAERGVSLSLMDMVDISKSRTFLAQFGLVGKENALRQNYRKCSVVAAEIRIAKANVAILLRQR